VTHHQNARVLARKFYKLFALIRLKRERLFDEHILSGENCELRKLEVLRGRRCDGHGMHVRHRKDVIYAIGGGDGVGISQFLQAERIDITNGSQAAQHMEVSYEVPTPEATTDHRDAR